MPAGSKTLAQEATRISAADRLAVLTRHLFSVGSASIQDLAILTGASEATIRRDLTQLAAAGTVLRSHGGAQIADRTDEHLAFGVRENENMAAKRAIADRAYLLIRPNSAILLDSGTTVLQLAKRLRAEPLPLTVVTNGVKVALELLNVAGIHVILLGGTMRHANLSVDGPQAEAMLDKMWFDQVFIGAGGIGADAMIYSNDGPGANLNLKMTTRTDESHVLANATKFGRRGTYQVAPISVARSVISDAGLNDEWQQVLYQAGATTCVAAATNGYEEANRRAAELDHRQNPQPR